MRGTKVRDRIIGWTVLAAGVLLAVFGVLNGQYADVFRKAIFICMECIGIG